MFAICVTNLNKKQRSTEQTFYRIDIEKKINILSINHFYLKTQHKVPQDLVGGERREWDRLYVVLCVDHKHLLSLLIHHICPLVLS